MAVDTSVKSIHLTEQEAEELRQFVEATGEDEFEEAVGESGREGRRRDDQQTGNRQGPLSQPIDRHAADKTERKTGQPEHHLDEADGGDRDSKGSCVLRQNGNDHAEADGDNHRDRHQLYEFGPAPGGASDGRRQRCLPRLKPYPAQVVPGAACGA